MKLYQRLPMAVFILINCLFIYKYASRFNDYFPLIIIFYAAIASAGLIYLHRIPESKFNNNQIYIVLALFTVAAIIIFLMIDINSLDVDRWSVIDSFWESAFNGDFPYAARSIHDNAPGPFPFYFIMALPFHLAGEIGWMTVLGFFGLAWLLYKRSRTAKPVVILLLLVATAPVTLWELSTRSTIFFNMTAVLLFITWLEYKPEMKSREQFLTGLIGGLILSTRGFVAIPFLAFFSFAYLRTRQVKEFFIRGFGVIIGFFITLIPFLLWDIEKFKIYNPITLQAGFLNLPLLIIFFVLAILAGLKATSACRFYSILSLLLFTVITAAFIITASEFGWDIAFHKSAFDISYYILAVPFLILACPKLKSD